jgi:hypothetical protein
MEAQKEEARLAWESTQMMLRAEAEKKAMGEADRIWASIEQQAYEQLRVERASLAAINDFHFNDPTLNLGDMSHVYQVREEVGLRLCTCTSECVHAFV